MKIKICGIQTEEDVSMLNKYHPDMAGFVMFYEKSHRNLSIEKARKLKSKLDSHIQTVAVTVSPDIEQVEKIKEAGFDYIQIHGYISDNIYDQSDIDIIRAFNVSNIDEYRELRDHKIVKGFLFDARTPGSGETFDWNLVKDIDRGDKMFIMAGGINENNVVNVMKETNPDAIDVSSGVEKPDGTGKDENKVRDFIQKIRESEYYMS